MKIDGKYYRIKEKVYKDGHKEYTAQKAINFYLFKIWRNFSCGVTDYGYGSINWICCGETYEDCKKYLLETLEEHKKQKAKTTIDVVNKIY